MNIRKNIIATLLIGLVYTTGLMAQNNKLKLNIELDLVQPIFGGYGGTIGIEYKHWGFGFMGFATPLNKSNRDIILTGAQGLDVFNWGVEVYADYYLNKTHKGFFMGVLASVDGYELSKPGIAKQTVHALYMVPRIGYRVTFGKLPWLYVQPAFAVPLKVWDNSQNYHDQNVGLSNALLLPMLTAGVQF